MRENMRAEISCIEKAGKIHKYVWIDGIGGKGIVLPQKKGK